MQPHLQRIEVEPARRGDDDLAVEHAAVGQACEQRVVQLRKVAVERPQVAALDEHVVAAAEHDGAEAVPFRLVEEPVAVGESRRRAWPASARWAVQSDTAWSSCLRQPLGRSWVTGDGLHDGEHERQQPSRVEQETLRVADPPTVVAGPGQIGVDEPREEAVRPVRMRACSAVSISSMSRHLRTPLSSTGTLNLATRLPGMSAMCSA